MRELKEFSLKDNMSYLKAEYNPLYSALVDMVVDEQGHALRRQGP